MRRLISASAVSVVVLGIVGAVSGVAVATGTPLTKAEYVTQYNALCDASITQFQAKLHALGPDHDTDQVVAVIVPIYQDRVAKVRKLVAPTADRKRVEALIAAQQTAIGTVKDDHEVLNGSRVDLFAFSEGKKAEQVATRYGLES